MSLDTNTVKQIAFLARIRVPDEELAPLVGELNNILHFVEQLSEVDTQGVPPLASVADVGLPRRDDAVTDGNCQDKVLANGPEVQDGFYCVPKVVE
ncbi:MAG: Asp-tRNA(Asn)/Glu-tRNA(Gln) amidotransferase subunit GatC [Magnetospirillum sp. WYHS-4]